MAQKISINKEYIEDVAYRYKMSVPILKYEGNGNGQRTVFLNIQEISTQINRDAKLLLSYLSLSLGCQTINNKDGLVILYGTHENEKILNIIYDFINIFVLCSKCKNPETVFIKEKKNIYKQCNACSGITDIPYVKNADKIISKIVV